MDFLRTWLTERGLTDAVISIVVPAVLFALVLLAAWFAHVVIRRIVLRVLKRIVAHTRTRWDDILLSENVFERALRLVPAIILHVSAPVIFSDYPRLASALQGAMLVVMVVLVMVVAFALLNGVLSIYREFQVSRRFPLQGMVQIVKIVILFVGGILIVSLLVNRSPLILFSGLGALTAVLLLVFKDAILGFVAGIQLTANRMLQVGDWITMHDYGADGDVLEVSLTTVKVQNWDKTITTIPTYALISDSFQNWRGMMESGGRRIKRSISIDMTSVRICDDAMVERFRKFAYIRDYIDRKKEELAEWNASREVDDDTWINGRRLTNIGTFRAYVEAYLRNHSQINPDMTFLVRQLPPSPEGLPIEIYVFSKDIRWAYYEAIQADIFDHIIAVVPEFGLRVFQNPTGADWARLGASRT